jgi:hypothetical protein
MFRPETEKDDLPPEILRRLQVEELWARRNVLAGLMNAERLKAYGHRRIDLETGCAPMDSVSRVKPNRRAATVLTIKSRKSFAHGA